MILSLITPTDAQQQLAEAFKAVRLKRNHSRATAASLSGVPESTLKKFEGTGEISLRKCLQLCHVYGDLSTTAALFTPEIPITMDDFLKAEAAGSARQRGRL